MLALWLVPGAAALGRAPTDSATATAGRGRVTVEWPGPSTRMPPRRQNLQDVARELYRRSLSSIALTPHARGGTLTIDGRRYALMLGRCALPADAFVGDPGGYIDVAGVGRALVTFSIVETRRHVGITFPDGRWFLGAAPGADPGALHGTLEEPNFHYLRYEQKARQLLGPQFARELDAMPRARRQAYEDRLDLYVARAVPRWSWSVRLTCG